MTATCDQCKVALDQMAGGQAVRFVGGPFRFLIQGALWKAWCRKCKRLVGSGTCTPAVQARYDRWAKANDARFLKSLRIKVDE
jgi:hypothetical protein